MKNWYPYQPKSDTDMGWVETGKLQMDLQDQDYVDESLEQYKARLVAREFLQE